MEQSSGKDKVTDVGVLHRVIETRSILCTI